MADYGAGCTLDWIKYHLSESLSQFIMPAGEAGNYEVVEKGLWENNWVAEAVEEGTWNNDWVVGKKGADLMVGAAGSDGQRSPSGSSNGDFLMAESVVGVEAPQAQGTVNAVNLVGNKTGAEWVGPAPPRARGSKRKRSASGSTKTAGREASGALAASGSRVRRRSKSAWWHKVSSPGYPDADFKRDFHMSRSSFDTLCDMLASSVAKEDTFFRAAVPVPERVAVCVFRLATGEKFRDLEKRFGIGTSSCHKILREVVAAINTVFQPGTLSALWPDGAEDMAAAAGKFQDLTGGIPGVIGAVYTTHVPINAPDKDALTHHSRCLTERHKGKIAYSVTLQAAVDADGAFTSLCVGNPGTTSDEEIFSVSMSRKRTDEMVAQGKRLVGGAAYPLTDWTLVPYTHSNLTLPQETFNKKVALARGVALDAFRRLRARWAILEKRASWKANDLQSVMTACCVLHNLCERSGDKLGDELKGFKLEDDEIVVDNLVRSAAAEQLRDEIAQSLLDD